jgi:RHS repeat-associated protein
VGNGVRPFARTPWTLNGLRFYDPAAMRFLTRDPIGYDGGINLYAFCGNNPVMGVDPLGLDFVLGPREHPWLVFTSEGAKKGLATGVAVAADTYSFGLYSSRAYKNEPGYEGAAVLASLSREAALQAAGIGAAKWLGRVRPVQLATRFSRIRLNNYVTDEAGERVLGLYKPGDKFITLSRAMIRQEARDQGKGAIQVLRETAYHEAFHRAIAPLERGAAALIGRDPYNIPQYERFIEGVSDAVGRVGARLHPRLRALRRLLPWSR